MDKNKTILTIAIRIAMVPTNSSTQREEGEDPKVNNEEGRRSGKYHTTFYFTRK